MAPARRPGAGTNQEAVRRHNLGTLLAHLHHDGQLSRAELTVRLGLNRSTIAVLVGELVQLGAVVEQIPSRGRTGAGRPSLDVRPSPGSVAVVAVEVGVDVLQAAVVGLGGELLARATTRTPSPGEPEAVASATACLVRTVLADVDGGAALLGLGVAVPGMVRGSDGVVRFAPNLGWVDVPFAQLLQSRIDAALPVAVANDADLGALSEHVRGAAMGCQDVVFVAADAGVGGGIIVGGQPLHGSGGYAGELGHLVVDPRGNSCRCGSRGCWETTIGAGPISKALRLGSSEPDLIVTRLAGTVRPNTALRSVGRYLGLGLGSIVNAFNPEVIVLGGLLRWLYPVVQQDVDRALATAAMPAPREQVRVVVPGLGGDSVLIGAAEMAFGPLLADPARELTRAGRGALAARLSAPAPRLASSSPAASRGRSP